MTPVAEGSAAAAREAAIDPRVLAQAADWLVRLNDSSTNAADRAACERWLASHPEHARAWARAERLMQMLGGVPASLAVPALDRRPVPRRRAALARALSWMAVAPVAWGGWRLAEQQGWRADYRTATGERGRWALADGSRVHLNTDTAIDVRFDGTQRLIVLQRGEIVIDTAPDVPEQHRAFRVQTRHGLLQALGTTFSVRLHDTHTHVAVTAGAVRIAAQHAPAHDHPVVPAGSQARFSARHVDAITAVDVAALSWTQGLLRADNLPLTDFIDELGRYHRGLLRVDPALATLRVSGAFPAFDTAASLDMLAATYPLALATRFQGYWITLVPR